MANFERDLINSILEQTHFNLTRYGRAVEDQPARVAVSNAAPEYFRGWGRCRRCCGFARERKSGMISLLSAAMEPGGIMLEVEKMRAVPTGVSYVVGAVCLVVLVVVIWAAFIFAEGSKDERAHHYRYMAPLSGQRPGSAMAKRRPLLAAAGRRRSAGVAARAIRPWPKPAVCRHAATRRSRPEILPSMEQSRAVTRKSASNLALAFVLLPREKRDAMSGLYAFCREVDDIADNDSMPVVERRGKLAAWRIDIRRACGGESPAFPVDQELQPMIRRYRLPFRLFDELIQGVEMDLDTNRYQTHEELDLYCYRVASVVGLLSIEIFGYQDPACKEYVFIWAKALQLTQYSAGREWMRSAARNLFAAGRARSLQGFSRGDSEIPILSTILRTGCKRGSSRAEFLSARARNPAAGRSPVHGRGRCNGFGLLASATETGTKRFRCFRSESGAAIEQRPETAFDS